MRWVIHQERFVEQSSSHSIRFGPGAKLISIIFRAKNLRSQKTTDLMRLAIGSNTAVVAGINSRSSRKMISIGIQLNGGSGGRNFSLLLEHLKTPVTCRACLRMITNGLRL